MQATSGLRMRAAYMVLRGLFHLVWRVRVVGLAQVPAGPCILCPNHLGWTDALLVLQALPLDPPIAVVAESAGVLRDPLRHWLAQTFPIMVPLDRAQPVAALRRAQATLAQGRSLILFPEGIAGTCEGALLPLQPGAAHLSLHSGLPILPIGLTGTHELWLRRTLTVRVGAPLYPRDFATGALRDRTTALTAALTVALTALLPGDPAHPRFKPLARRLTGLF